MRILLTGDIHLRDNPPSTCTEEYLPELFSHLLYIGQMAESGIADAIVFAGDMFDNKIPNRNSHRLVQRTIEILKSYRVPLYILPGNHDEGSAQIESVFDTQPLGVLYRAGAAHFLSGWSHSPTWKGEPYQEGKFPLPFLPVYGVPWLPEWDYEDSPQRESVVEEAVRELSTHDSDSPVLVVTHAPFFRPGKESPYENYPTDRFAAKLRSVYRGPISVYYGHIHEPHGIYEVDGVTFANAGALSRGSLHEYNINRPIQVTIWDSETGLFEIVEIPHLPASRIYKLEEVEEAKSAKMELDTFLSEVGSTTLPISNTENVVEYVRSLKVEPAVIQVVQDLLDEVKK